MYVKNILVQVKLHLYVQSSHDPALIYSIKKIENTTESGAYTMDYYNDEKYVLTKIRSW